MGFVFYDLETTGISPAFDQPLQFAAIRTDDSCVEIERVDLRCRIVPHIIPSPQALIVTGVSPVRKVTRGACFTINWIKVWIRFGLAPNAHKGRNAAIEVNP